MAFLTVRGISHYYEWITQSPHSLESSKDVMVFLHGWGGSARYWEPIAQELSDQYDCLLYDLRGFGRSQANPSVDLDSIKQVYDLETYASDLAALLAELGLENVVVHAHSTGSSIAAIFANRYPERVKRAILACNGIFEYEAKLFDQFHKFGGLVVKFRPKWMVSVPGLDHMFMARFLSQSIPRAQKHQFLADFVDADQGAALGTMLTAVSKESAASMPQEFSTLSQPTLLISGARDRIIPAEMGRKAADLNEKITFKVIERTGHFPMLEKPAEYLNHVKSFLQADAILAAS